MLSWAITWGVCAQNHGVELIASPRQDAILLRWAPVNADSWELANKYGYSLERYTIVRGRKVLKQVEKVDLNKEAIKPKSLEYWQEFATDKYVSIAAECIFNTTYSDAPVGVNAQMAYKKYKERQHRFSFALYAADQSLKAAQLSGLYWADNSALANEKYLYKVFINAPDSIPCDTSTAFTGLNEYNPLPKPLELRANWSDKNIELSWNILYLKHYYNAYFIEKSLDMGKSYHRLSNNNSVQLTDKGLNPDRQFASDSLLNNTDTLYYRVRGITPFGETSPPSDSVFGTGQLPITFAPVIMDEDVINNQHIKLTWIYSEEMNPYIQGFKLYRSEKSKGAKDIIYHGTNPLDRSFIDSTPFITNYYWLSVYNKSKEQLSPLSNFVQRIDSFPPQAPINIKGYIDTLGAVHLSWNKNQERDLDGYRIYRANNPKFEFSLVAPSIIKDTNYVDLIHLKVLNKYIYYRVKAIDVRDNASGFSAILRLARPDIIPPVPPVLKGLTLNKKQHGELHWVNSSSADIKHHSIYRKVILDSAFHELSTQVVNDSINGYFLDKSIESGQEYIYQLRAVDSSGNISSPSKPAYLKVPWDKNESIKLKRRVLTDQIKLSWQLKLAKPAYKVWVYRQVNDGPMLLLGHSLSQEYIDQELSPETSYAYCIKVEFSDGSTSHLSKPIKVNM